MSHVCRVDIYSSSLSDAELTSSLLLDVHMFVCILNCSSVNQIFVDFAFKVLNLGYNTTIRLQLWDIAGHAGEVWKGEV